MQSPVDVKRAYTCSNQRNLDRLPDKHFKIIMIKEKEIIIRKQKLSKIKLD